MMTLEEQAAEAMERVTVKAGVFQPTTELPVQKVVTPKPQRSDIVVSDGMLVAQSLSEANRIAQALLDTGCVPKQYDSVPKILMGMQFLRQLGLPDIAGLPKLAIVRGTYALWGEGPKAVCQPLIEDFEEFWFDAKYKNINFENKNLGEDIWGALCRIKRKGQGTWVERTFTVHDALKANLWNKDGPWKQYPSRMLQMRARSWALKDGFPDKLMGIGIAEYDHDVIVENGNIIETQTQSKAAELVKRF